MDGRMIVMKATIDVGDTVGVLIANLMKLPQDAEIYVAENGYKLVADWEEEPLVNADDLR